MIAAVLLGVLFIPVLFWMVRALFDGNIVTVLWVLGIFSTVLSGVAALVMGLLAFNPSPGEQQSDVMISQFYSVRNWFVGSLIVTVVLHYLMEKKGFN